uniref:Uncharacterized protein n=1 Tax=Vespula pensylvanica TaxID=30213 RepID=A0A834PFB8_VESPE|nr:hypothetical protein H0235_001033 [Vespula pensylvanica]
MYKRTAIATEVRRMQITPHGDTVETTYRLATSCTAAPEGATIRHIILRILKDRRVRGIYQRIVGEPRSTRATVETSTASENRIRRKISPAISRRGQFSKLYRLLVVGQYRPFACRTQGTSLMAVKSHEASQLLLPPATSFSNPPLRLKKSVYKR